MNQDAPMESITRGRSWSSLALASLVLSVLPVGSIVAPILGALALVRLRRHPELRGAPLAWAGIAVGTVASILMVGGAYAMYRAFDELAHRPERALAAAWRGDAAAFRQEMTRPGSEATSAQLASWVRPLRERLGELVEVRLADAPPPAPTEPLPETELRAACVARFEGAAGRSDVPVTVVLDRPKAADAVSAIRIRRFEFILPDGARIVWPEDDVTPHEQPSAGDQQPR